MSIKSPQSSGDAQLDTSFHPSDTGTFLGTYVTSFNMNQLQQVCADERELPGSTRLEAIRYVLQTFRSVDINDETFERVIQTSYRLKNRPDAIPEVRRTVPSSTISSPNDSEGVVTLTTNPSSHLSKSSTSPILGVRTIGGGNKSQQFHQLSTTSATTTQHQVPNQIDRPYIPSTAVSTLSHYQEPIRSTINEHVNSQQSGPQSSQVPHTQFPSSSYCSTHDPNSTHLPQSVQDKIRTRDLLIVHLCQELQQFLTVQQYKNYVTRLFEDSGIDPPQYSEKRGGSYLSRSEARPPNANELAALVLGTSSQHPLRTRHGDATSDEEFCEDPASIANIQQKHRPDSHTPDDATLATSTDRSQSPPRSGDNDFKAMSTDVIPEEYPRLLIMRQNPYFSALHYICQNTARISNRMEIIHFMLSANSAANGHRQYNISPLYDIIINPAISTIGERLGIMKILLSSGANVNVHDSNNNNLIHVIISAPHLTINDKKNLISCLFEYGINMNHSNRYRHSPLETLCFSYQQQTLLPPVKALFLPALDQDKNTPTDTTSSLDGTTHLPASTSLAECDSDEISHQRKQQIPTQWSQTAVGLQHPQKYTPPHPHEPVVITPLSITSCPLYEESIQDRLDILTHLLRCGASVSGITPGTTLLHQLCANNFPHRLHYINALLCNGAPLNLADDSGDTPLHCLLANDHDIVGIIQLLWQHSVAQFKEQKDSTKDLTDKALSQNEPVIASITEPEDGINQRPNSQDVGSNTLSKYSKYQIVDNLGPGLHIKKECLDILAEVFLFDDSSSNLATTTSHVANPIGTQLIQPIPEDEPVDMNKQSQLQFPLSSNNANVPDGLAICKALLRHGANVQSINKNEYQPIDQHYFMLRGKLALNTAYEDQFVKLCQLETFTTSQPALELALHHHALKFNQLNPSLNHIPYLHLYHQVYQSDEEKIDPEEFQQQLMNLVRKHPVEIPYTNWLAKQHQLIQQHDIHEHHNTFPLNNDNDDFESISSSYPIYRHHQQQLKHQCASALAGKEQLEGSDSYLAGLRDEDSTSDNKSPEYSVSYHEVPKFMPNEMPIMLKSQTEEPIHPTQPRQRRPSYIDVIPLDNFVLPTIDLPIRKNPTSPDTFKQTSSDPSLIQTSIESDVSALQQ